MPQDETKSDDESADPCTAYAKAVAANRIVAGPLVRAACKRHLDDLASGALGGLAWMPDQAAQVYRFFAALRLVEGEHAGQPFYLEPWQCFVVGSLFGWYLIDGTRRFRTAYLEIGKGNGKTPLAAGLACYGLFGDGERGAEVYCAAVSREQAKISFRDVRNFVNACPALTRRAVVGEHNIAYPVMNSFLRPLSSEGSTLDGLRVHMAINDEVHAHPSAIVVDKVSAGTKGRRQPLIINITNSGADPNSVCGQQHDYSRKLVTGELQDDSWFAYVCGLDPCESHRRDGHHQPVDGCRKCDDWMRDTKVWVKANPNLGVSIHEKYLAKQVAEARGMPAKQNIIARLNFCVWTSAISAWIGKDRWDAVQVDRHREDLAGRSCIAAIDLSGVRDLTALAVLFPAELAGEASESFVEFWTPGSSLEARELRDKVPYSLWKRDHHLHAPDGHTVDYAQVAKRIGEIRREYRLRFLAFDRYKISYLIEKLEGEGIEAREIQPDEVPELSDDVLWIMPYGQGFKDMGFAIEAFEGALLNGTTRIEKNPVLTWNAASAVVVKDDAENRKFTKSKATGRIDGIVALAMAHGALAKGQIGQEQAHDWSGFLQSPVIG